MTVVMTSKAIFVVIVVIIAGVSCNGEVDDVNDRRIPDANNNDYVEIPVKDNNRNATSKLADKDLYLQEASANTTNGNEAARNGTAFQQRRSASRTDPTESGRTNGQKRKKNRNKNENSDVESRTMETESSADGKGAKKPRKPGQNKERKGVRKGDRKNKNNQKSRMNHQSNSYVDSPQSDSVFDGSNISSSGGYRKERPSAVSDKNNEALKDLKLGASKVSTTSCSEVQCLRGGRCEEDLTSARCHCQLGTKGQFCEKDVAVKFPKFSGTGHMAFPVLRGAFKEFTVDLQFRPDDENGLLLFSSDHPEARFDFFSVSLVNGHVEFRFDCGTGMGLVRTKNAVDLGKWNNLKIYRHDWSGYVKLNDGPEAKGKSKLTGWQYGRNSYGHFQWTYVAPLLPSNGGGALDNSWTTKWKTQSNDIDSYRQRFASFNSLDPYHPAPSFYKPKGIFTKMSFREHLFLGGYRNMTGIAARTGVSVGFSGCVRFLRINQKIYDMRKGAFAGDALYGMDVDECNGHACDKVKCLNGGSCASFGADSSVCLCPLGSIGDRCQSKNDVQIPSFDGHSYLQFVGLRRTVMSYSEMEIVFKTSDPDGLLFYNGYSTDGSGDFISLSLNNGTVEFRYDLGTGPAVIRSREPVSLDAWHSVRVARSGRNGRLQVDGETQMEGSSNGAFTQLTLTLDLFIGGHRNFDEVAKAAGITKSLQGCIQKVTINEKPLKLLDEALTGVNVADCPHSCAAQPCKNGGHCVPLKDEYHCECPLGFENTNCQDRTARYRYRYRYRRDVAEYSQTISIPRFAGDGFLMYTDPEIVQRTRGNRISVQLRLKATQANGLVFYVGQEGAEQWGDHLSIGLVDGHLQLSYNLGDEETVARDNSSTRLDDGRWHSVKVERYDQTGHMEIDGVEAANAFSSGTLKQLNTDGIVYIGGLPDVEQRTLGMYPSGLFGCLANLTLSSHLSVDLMVDAEVASNIGQCD